MIVAATNNKGKLREIKAILKDYDIKSLGEVNIDVDVIEDQDTFYGNASKKAHEIYELIHEPVIADDTGLCIDALDGFPGVMTHRFLGEDATDAERNEELIRRLENKESRNAKCICSLVYYDGKREIAVEGVLNGVIPFERRGDKGFGFDDIFELDNGLTLAEIDIEEKNKISARSMAVKKIAEELEKDL